MKRNLLSFRILCAKAISASLIATAVFPINHSFAQASLGSTIGAGETSLVFYDDFGTPVGRESTPYARKGTNAFIFGHSALEYPLPIPSGLNEGEFTWRNYARLIENNHYAIVAPRKIYSSVPFFVEYYENLPWTSGTLEPGTNPALPVYLTWESFITKNDGPTLTNPSGTADGGVMVVNAGLTPGVLYDRGVNLQRGKVYKLTYNVYVQNQTVEFKVNFLDENNEVGLGSSAPISMTKQGQWDEKVIYFSLPPNPGGCDNSNDFYRMNLQNTHLATGGNDYALDNIRVTEVESLPTGVESFIVVSKCDAIPVSGDDAITGVVVGTPAVINIGQNDFLSNGTTTPVFDGPGTNSTFNFLTPIGEKLDASGTSLTIAGEGTWSFNKSNGNLTFTPENGFLGNPFPIQYYITENGTGKSSAPATVTATYLLDKNPVATADFQEQIGLDGKYRVSIFDNDNVDNLSITGSPIIEIFNPLNESIGYTSDASSNNIQDVLVAGEGHWSYDNIEQEFIFVPLADFTGKPTPISYRFKSPQSDNIWSNWATVSVGESTVLPATGFTLAVHSKNNQNTLSWVTATEINTRSFVVEYSTNGTNFQTIATLAAKGNSNAQNSYSYVHSAATPVTYYRIKLTDFDGKISYSNLIVVNTNSSNTVSVYPNPANTFVQVAINNAGTYQLTLFNTSGTLVQSHKINALSKQVYTIQRQHLPSGLYFIKVTDANGVTTTHKIQFN